MWQNDDSSFSRSDAMNKVQNHRVPANAAVGLIVRPFMSSPNAAVEGGEVANGLGDGGGVLAQDAGVAARDLRAHLELRVAGEDRIEHGPSLFHLPALG